MEINNTVLRAKNRAGQWINLDTYNNVPILLTKQIGDIRNILQRKNSSSRSILLPDTPTNNEFFQYFTEINNYETFQANRKTACQVCDDSAEVQYGYLRFVKATRNDYEQGKREYEIQIFGEIFPLLANLDEQTLGDLDLSEFDHTFSYSALYSTRNDTPGPFKYPYIDYGAGFTINKINNPSNYNILHYKNLRMVFQCKTLLDKIFEQGNSTYEGSFLNSDFFKRNYETTSKPRVNPEAVENAKGKFVQSFNRSIYYNASIVGTQGFATKTYFNPDDDNTNGFDFNDNYTPGSPAVYTAPSTGWYRFTLPIVISASTRMFYELKIESQNQPGLLYKSATHYGTNALEEVTLDTTWIYLTAGRNVAYRIDYGVIQQGLASTTEYFAIYANSQVQVECNHPANYILI